MKQIYHHLACTAFRVAGWLPGPPLQPAPCPPRRCTCRGRTAWPGSRSTCVTCVSAPASSRMSYTVTGRAGSASIRLVSGWIRIGSTMTMQSSCALSAPQVGTVQNLFDSIYSSVIRKVKVISGIVLVINYLTVLNSVWNSEICGPYNGAHEVRINAA